MDPCLMVDLCVACILSLIFSALVILTLELACLLTSEMPNNFGLDHRCRRSKKSPVSLRERGTDFLEK
jgi:hypothetical protein